MQSIIFQHVDNFLVLLVVRPSAIIPCFILNNQLNIRITFITTLYYTYTLYRAKLSHPGTKQGFYFYLPSKIRRSLDAATPTDLWDSMQLALDAANETVTFPGNATVESIMETWNSQSGYPVVYVERNYTSGSLTISQVLQKQHIKVMFLT